MTRCLLIGAVLLSAIGATAAHADSDRQQWLTLNGEIAVDGNDSIGAAAILRSKADSFEVGQRILRLGYTHRLHSGVSFNMAYTHVRGFVDNGPDLTQHRLSQTLAAPIGKLAGGGVDGRLQLEEVFASGSDTMGVRLRPRLRWQHKLDSKGRFEAQISDEVILSLNDTNFGQTKGFTANRAGGALRMALNKHMGVAPGYTWQIVNRPTGPMRNDHIMGLTVDARF